ncbi:hypothetical protein F4167_21860 [Candidatus Poribacteria bacterium]|nr:hypothetical protein [Candidatus Poribacteria bacterium]
MDFSRNIYFSNSLGPTTEALFFTMIEYKGYCSVHIQMMDGIFRRGGVSPPDVSIIYDLT